MSSDCSSRAADRHDPLATWRRRFVAVAGASLLVIGGVGVWAMGPVARSEWQVRASTATVAPARVADAASPVDRAAFEKNLWASLTKPGALDAAAAAKEKPRELPLEIDLVGVTDVNGTLVAALYDRRADRLLLVKSGESVAGAEVSEITKDQVTLKRGVEQKVLARRRPGP